MGVIHELVETVSPDTVYDAVYYFFCNNSLISRCGCFILDDYAKHIEEEYQQYNSSNIAANGGRANSQWARIFDESITRNKTKYPDLSFKLAFTSSYWEIYVTKMLTGNGVQTCTDPILNVRSIIFEREFPKIIFYEFPRTKNHAATENERKNCNILYSDI